MAIARVRRAIPPRRSKPQIEDIKTSFIWTRAVPDLFAGTYRGPAAALASRPRYSKAFDKGDTGPHGMDPRFLFPWDRPVGQLFWTNYLGLDSLQGIRGSEAWRAVVPLRERLPLGLPSAGQGVLSYAEAFYYPHGLGLVLTVRARDLKGALDKRVEQFRALVQETDVEVSIDGTVETGRLTDVAAKVMRRLLLERVDAQADAAGGRAGAFSITAIIQGTPINPATELAGDGELRRALHALAGWSPSWEHDALADLNDVSIRRSQKPAGHLLYTADRGRVVWFPAHFDTSSQRRRHSLSCYQRNLTLASLTVESLTALLADAHGFLTSGGRWVSLPADHRACVKNGAARLVDLFNGTATYRTRSAPLQITANGGKTLINAMANQLEVAPLP